MDYSLRYGSAEITINAFRFSLWRPSDPVLRHVFSCILESFSSQEDRKFGNMIFSKHIWNEQKIFRNNLECAKEFWIQFKF